MVKFALVATVGAILSASAANAASIYQQCGGIGWTGSTVCDAGLACVILNAYYFQCLTPAAGQTTTGSGALVSTSHSSSTTSSVSFSFSGSSHSTTGTTATKTTTTPSTTTTLPAISVSGRVCSGSRTKFKFFGVNESGAEFGNTAWPGQLGKDYTWPSPSSVDYFMGAGFNTFRITFLMERMSPPATGLTGPFNQTYLSGLTTIVDYITNKGGYALIDPHNFMRYNNGIISSTSDFATWWSNLATVFKSTKNAIFDIQNEPYGIDAQTVYELNQAAINSIRAAGATSQLILVEGTSYTGAWTWVSSGNGAAFAAVTDPYNNTAVEMHQYLDSDGSGTNEDCVSSTIGSQRLQAATAWLQQTGLKGFLGETGAGSNSQCIDAVFDELCYMQQQGGSWIGALWWAAGPWWGTYIYSIEPPSGAAIPEVLPQGLAPFL